MFAFELLGSPLAAVLMDLDNWYPIYLGFLIYIPIVLLICLLPNDLGIPSQKLHSQVESLPSPTSDNESFAIPGAYDSSQAEELTGARTQSIGILLSTYFMDNLTTTCKGLGHFAQNNFSVAMLLFTRLTTTLGRSAQELLLQFARRRFGWSWSQVSLVFTFYNSPTVSILTELHCSRQATWFLSKLPS